MNFLFLQPNTSEPLRNTVVEALTALWTKVASFAPQFVGMLVILIVGFFVSKFLQKMATVLLRKLKLDLASLKIGLKDTLDKVGIGLTASEIMGKLVFWLFMLTFLISASEALGLENVSKTIDSFVAYLPNVIAAALIAVVGLVLAHFVGNLVRTGATSIGLEYAAGLARLTYGVLIVVIGTLVIDQLGIETTLINRVIEIMLFAAGAGLAIALGFGSKEIAKNILAGLYARELYRLDTELTVSGQKGKVGRVGTVNTQIIVEDGHTLHIPNIKLIDQVVEEST